MEEGGLPTDPATSLVTPTRSRFLLASLPPAPPEADDDVPSSPRCPCSSSCRRFRRSFLSLGAHAAEPTRTPYIQEIVPPASRRRSSSGTGSGEDGIPSSASSPPPTPDGGDGCGGGGTAGRSCFDSVSFGCCGPSPSVPPAPPPPPRAPTCRSIAAAPTGDRCIASTGAPAHAAAPAAAAADPASPFRTRYGVTRVPARSQDAGRTARIVATCLAGHTSAPHASSYRGGCPALPPTTTVVAITAVVTASSCEFERSQKLRSVTPV